MFKAQRPASQQWLSLWLVAPCLVSLFTFIGPRTSTNRDSSVQIQRKIASLRSERPIRVLPRLARVFLRLLSKKFVGYLTPQQHASVSQGRICLDDFTCCHTEIEVADPTFHLTQSQYTDSGPTSPSTDPITPGAWQGSHWSANF